MAVYRPEQGKYKVNQEIGKRLKTGGGMTRGHRSYGKMWGKFPEKAMHNITEPLIYVQSPQIVS